eukprot:6204906-Pleurochrysis_carterae.AAC.1
MLVCTHHEACAVNADDEVDSANSRNVEVMNHLRRTCNSDQIAAAAIMIICFLRRVVQTRQLTSAKIVEAASVVGSSVRATHNLPFFGFVSRVHGS